MAFNSIPVKVGDKVKVIEEKTISKYLNIPLLDVDELDVVKFKFYLREAFIYNSSLTEEGIEYLRNVKGLKQLILNEIS